MWGNIIAGTLVLLAVSFAILSIYKNRKQGKCCGCSSDCPNSEKCRKNN